MKELEFRKYLIDTAFDKGNEDCEQARRLLRKGFGLTAIYIRNRGTVNLMEDANESF